MPERRPWLPPRRISSRVQITTDGHKAYLEAVEGAFGMDCDYAQLQKVYGAPAENQTRYSPATCIGCDMKTVSGNPDPKHVSKSYVERQNLTMRMHMRRFTRLTNGFSKKVENHAAAVALWFMYYKFCRVHSTLLISGQSPYHLQCSMARPLSRSGSIGKAKICAHEMSANLGVACRGG